MVNNKAITQGILLKNGPTSYILDDNSKKHFQNRPIWSGYIKHWTGKRVCARILPQLDYENRDPIIIMWPNDDKTGDDFIELYYNEKLLRYPISFLGHIAININGNIFNFSNMINENEIISHEEYFHRPALGEFAPHPELGVFNADDENRPYLDKFGRQFMRTIHVLRIHGLDAEKFLKIFKAQLEIIHNTPKSLKNPEKYRDFKMFTRSCTTIIRDGFREYGFTKISGMFPRDLFIDVWYNFTKKIKTEKIKVQFYKMPQLKVPEVPYSKKTVIINPINWYKNYKLKT